MDKIRKIRKEYQSWGKGYYHLSTDGWKDGKLFYTEGQYAHGMTLTGLLTLRLELTIYDFSLLDNHVHLLLQEGEEPLGMIFRRIGTKYVYWFNRRYERTGHLFQDRFRSETVEDDAGFVTVLRYIHLNPVKAGLCKVPEEYPYSSYARYFDPDSLTDPGMILGMMDREAFYRFHRENTEDRCMDIPDRDRKLLSDEKALRILKERFGCGSAAEFGKLPEDKRTTEIRHLLKTGGSLRQVSRLTGVSVGIVRKYM